MAGVLRFKKKWGRGWGLALNQGLGSRVGAGKTSRTGSGFGSGHSIALFVSAPKETKEIIL